MAETKSDRWWVELRRSFAMKLLMLLMRWAR